MESDNSIDFFDVNSFSLFLLSAILLQREREREIEIEREREELIVCRGISVVLNVLSVMSIVLYQVHFFY